MAAAPPSISSSGDNVQEEKAEVKGFSHLAFPFYPFKIFSKNSQQTPSISLTQTGSHIFPEDGHDALRSVLIYFMTPGALLSELNKILLGRRDIAPVSSVSSARATADRAARAQNPKRGVLGSSATGTVHQLELFLW